MDLTLLTVQPCGASRLQRASVNDMIHYRIKGTQKLGDLHQSRNHSRHHGEVTASGTNPFLRS